MRTNGNSERRVKIRKYGLNAKGLHHSMLTGFLGIVNTVPAGISESSRLTDSIRNDGMLF